MNRNTTVRVASLVVTALTVFGSAACEDPKDFVLPVPAKLRLGEMQPTQRALVRAEIEGQLIPKTGLVFDDELTTLSGIFEVVTESELTIPVTIRVLGRLNADSEEVVLGVATRALALKPREATRLEFADEDWRIDGAAVFDPNGNGAPSVDDLVKGFDPAPFARVLDVSPGDLQFASGTRPGDFTRQVVIVENVSGLPQELTAEVIGGQGMSIVRVDATGTPDVGAPRSLDTFTLQPFQEQLLAVTFAPTNGFLVRGSLALHTMHTPSLVTSVEQIGLFANSDGDPQPVPPGYDPGALDGGAIGFSGAVQAYPPTLLFGGQPLTPGTIPLSLEPNDVLVVEPLGYAASAVGGVPASSVFLVQIPPRHRLSVELSGLIDNADLGLFLLDENGGDALSADPAELFVSRNPHTSPEVAQVRNRSSTDARRAVIVVGRVDGREVPGAPADPADIVPFQLLTQLNAGPELDDTSPIDVTTSPFRGGQEVQIRGFAFEAGATVRFGSHVADRTQTTVSEDGTVVTTVTPSADEGDVGVPLVVVVTNPDGQAATHPPVFLYDPPAPVVDSVDPLTANVNGGTPLVIRGAFFSGDNGGPRVLVGGNPATGVVRVSASEISAVAPAGVAGPSSVVVENIEDTGEATPSASFPFVYVADAGDPPTITSVDPDTGGTDGGDEVIITGTGFTVASSVRFGGSNASGVVFIDETTLTCVTPPRAAGGLVDVLVINADGRVALAQDAYNYQTPPPRLIDSVPDLVSQLGGTRLFIDGGDLRPGVTAIFRQGNVSVPAAAVDFVSSSRLIVTSPSGLLPGAVELFVVNPDAQVSEILTLTVVAPTAPPPRMVSVSPGSVRIDNLVPVTVVGTGFDGGLLLFVDEEQVPVTNLSATTFTFTPPVRAPGAAILRVVNGDGQTDARTFIYDPPLSPVFFSVSPDSVGALIPGDVITLQGANLGIIPAGELDARVRVENAAGTLFASTVLEQSSTLLRLRLDDELPDATDYRVVVDYPPQALSPTFAAFEPVVLSQQVVSGQPTEGSAFSVLVQGVSLKKDAVSAVRFTLAQDQGAPLVVDVAVAVATTTLVRADVPAASLVQGAWTTALVFSFTNAAGQADTLVLDVPGEIIVSGECGNGVLDAGEQCDTVELADETCATRGFFGGNLGCTASCVFDTRQCNRCGDGIIDAADGEECDGANIGATTCGDLTPGSTSGTPGCSTQCTLTEGSCATCGNGFAEGPLEGGEQCDGTDFRGATCSTLGFNAGQISCDPASCTLSADLCSTCGNNRCDVLETSANCAVDCASTCGNNVCDAAERCTTCPRDCGGQCEDPYTLTLVSGAGQSGRFASDLVQPLIVEARAQGNGAPLVGLQVTFTAPTGGAVSPALVLTDANGRASTQATLPRTLGAATFVATGTDPDGALLENAPLDIPATSQDIASGVITTLVNQPAVAGRTSLLSGSTPAPVAALKIAVNLDLSSASGVVVRPSDGSIFFSDTNNHRVLRIAPDGRAFLAAGSNGGTIGFTDNVPATSALLNRPRGLALDAQENLYIADSSNNRIRKVDASSGLITTFAGGGASTNEGVLATSALLATPSSIVFAPSGEAFVANAAADNIKKIDVAGIMTTAITPAGCSTNSIRAANIDDTQLAIDPQGRLVFFANVVNIGGCPVIGGDHLLRLEANGTLTSLAGGNVVVVNGTAKGAQLLTPAGLAVDDAGNAYVTERPTTGRRLRKISSLGVISTVAGSTGVAATSTTRGDGGPSTSALLGLPGFLAFSPDGDLVLTDSGLHDVRLIRDIAEDTAPVVTAVGFGGGQTAAINQALATPLGVTVTDSLGNRISGVFVQVTVPPGASAEPASGFTDGNGVFSFVGFVGRAPGPYAFTLTSTGVDGLPLGAPLVLTTTATDVASGVITSIVNQTGTASSGIRTSAARSNINVPTTYTGVAVDPDDGTLYVSDTNNDRVLRIDPSGAIRVVAGTGAAGNGGNGPALTIALNAPRGLALDEDNNLYIADSNNDVVRVLTTDGNLTIFAGSALNQVAPNDGVVATGANLDFPTALAIGPRAADGTEIPGLTGDVFIVDQSHQRIRQVDVDPSFPAVPGVISSVVVAGQSCSTGNLRASNLNNGALAFDLAGRLYFGATVGNAGGCPVPDPNGAYVFRVEDNGALTAVAGGNIDTATGPAFGTRLSGPSGLAVDPAGNLYIAENGGHRIRRVDVLGGMTTISGDGVAGFNNDNVQAASSRINFATGMAFDSARNLYFVDNSNQRVRMIRDIGNVTPATATISIFDGDAQTGTIGQIAPLPLRVRVVDGNDQPVVNLPVFFSALDLGDTVTQRTVSTTIAGEASTTVRLGRSSTTPHRFQATARTWLNPADIVDELGEIPVFTLTAARPPSGSSVAIANSQGISGLSGGEIAATEARLALASSGIALAEDGTLFVADSDNSRIVTISPEGHFSVFAGTGTVGFLDNVPATQGLLDTPRGVAIDADGNVYIADASPTLNRDRIRKVGLDGIITTIAGGAADTPGHGDGGTGTGVFFSDPRHIAIGPDGFIYVVDAALNSVRRVDPVSPHTTTTQLVEGGGCSSGTGLRHFDLSDTGLAWDATGRMYFVANNSNAGGCPTPALNVNNIFRQELNGTLTFIAGTATNNATTKADGQAGNATFIPNVGTLAFDDTGALLYTEVASHRIRRLPGVQAVVAGTQTGAAGPVTTLIGTVDSAGFSSLTQPGSGLTNGPNGLVRDPVSGDLYWTEDGSNSVRLRIP